MFQSNCFFSFLDRVDAVRREDFVPSQQDILRNRIMTNTIQRMDFTVPDGGRNVQFRFQLLQPPSLNFT